MEKSAQPIVEPEKQGASKLLNKMLEYAAFPVAFVSGLWVANTSLTSSAYDKAKFYGKFKEINEKFWGEHAQDVELAEKKIISQPEFTARMLANKGAHSAAIGTHMKERALGNIFAKWKSINREGKQKAVIEGMTVAGIAVGATLSIVNSKILSEIIGDKPQESGKEH